MSDSGRVTGYRYVIGKDGRKHRVYPKGLQGNSNSSIPAAPRQRAPRMPNPRVFQGQGGYYNSTFVKTMKKYVPKGTIAAFGDAMAGPAGRALGKQAAKILGFGDYAITSNSIVDEGQSPANMHSNSNTLKVRHREYIQDVVSSSSANTFTNQTIPIQPGLEGSFPWLAQIAQQYEQYKILGMVFEFKSLSADAVSSSQANMTIGGVIMATDYNALNPSFTSKQQMDNTQYTTSCKPSVSFYHPIECAPHLVAQDQYYVRSDSIPANADARLYDLGNFQIASFGIAAASVVLGELWCTYEIEFSKPIVSPVIGSSSAPITEHWYLSGVVAGTTPLGTTSTKAPGSNINGTITAASPAGGNQSRYTFNSASIEAGQSFLVQYDISGSSALITYPPEFTLGDGLQALELFGGGGNPFVGTPSGSTTAVVTLVYAVTVTNPNLAYIDIAAAELPGAIVSGDLLITQLNPLIE